MNIMVYVYLLDVLLATIGPDHVLVAGVDAFVGLAVDEARVEGGPCRHQVLLLVRPNAIINTFISLSHYAKY